MKSKKTGREILWWTVKRGDLYEAGEGEMGTSTRSEQTKHLVEVDCQARLNAIAAVLEKGWKP